MLGARGWGLGGGWAQLGDQGLPAPDHLPACMRVRALCALRLGLCQGAQARAPARVAANTDCMHNARQGGAASPHPRDWPLSRGELQGSWGRLAQPGLRGGKVDTMGRLAAQRPLNFAWMRPVCTLAHCPMHEQSVLAK